MDPIAVEKTPAPEIAPPPTKKAKMTAEDSIDDNFGEDNNNVVSDVSFDSDTKEPETGDKNNNILAFDDAKRKFNSRCFEVGMRVSRLCYNIYKEGYSAHLKKRF